MTDELRSLLEGIIVPMGMAMFGGFAKTASQGWKSWKHFFGSIIISSFAGVVVHLVLLDHGFTPATKAAFVGLSGYMGVLVLDGLSYMLLKILEKVTGQQMRPKWDGRERRKSRRDGDV